MHYGYRDIEGTLKKCSKWRENLNCRNIKAELYCTYIYDPPLLKQLYAVRNNGKNVASRSV
jgi:hypothetical protein